MVLESEHALSIAKVLWVLYNGYHMFSLEAKREICEILFDDIFFKYNKTIIIVIDLDYFCTGVGMLDTYFTTY